jgi:hypothetical protein
MRSGEHDLTEVKIPKRIIGVALALKDRCAACAQVQLKLRPLENRGTAKVHEWGKTQQIIDQVLVRKDICRD